MPSAPQHSCPSFSSTISTPSVLLSSANSTLIAAPSPPPPPGQPSRSSSRYSPSCNEQSSPHPFPIPLIPDPCPAHSPLPQGSASCPPSQAEKVDQGEGSWRLVDMNPQGTVHHHHHHQVVKATGALTAAAQEGEAAGVYSLPESVQMPGSPMMRTALQMVSFGTPCRLRLGRPVPVPVSSAVTASPQTGTFAGTAMAAGAATAVKGQDSDDGLIDMDDVKYATDVVDRAHHDPALLAIDGFGHQDAHSAANGDGDSTGEWEGRLGVAAANAAGLGSVPLVSSCPLPLPCCPSSFVSRSLASPSLGIGLGDSLPPYHHVHTVAAVLPAQHSRRSSIQAMSAIMSTPSSTHHSTPIGTPTSPPTAMLVASPTQGTNPVSATTVDVDQLFADMLASASVPVLAPPPRSASESADHAFVNALLSSATDLFSTPSSSHVQPSATPQSISELPPASLSAAPATVPDPDLFAFLSAVPEDELQAILAAADQELDDEVMPGAPSTTTTATGKITSRPASAFQSPMPQPEDRLLSDRDDDGDDDDTSSYPGSAFVPPPPNPHEPEESRDDVSNPSEQDDDAYKVRYGRRVIQVRTLEEGEVSGMSPPMGVLTDFTTTSSASDMSDADNDDDVGSRLPVTPPRALSARHGHRASPTYSSPTRSNDPVQPHFDLFAAAELPSAPGPNINSLFERHIAPTLVVSDTESTCALGLHAPPRANHQHDDEDEDEFGSPAAMPVFDDTTTLGAPASTMHQLRFAPLTVWTTAPLPFPQHLQYDAPPTPMAPPPVRPLSAASTASTATSTTTSALIDSLPWGQSEVVDSQYLRRRPRKPSMRVYPRFTQQQAYEPSSLHVPMSPASPSSPGVGYSHGTSNGAYMSPPPPSYHLSSASASSALPSPHGSNESVPPVETRPRSPPAMSSTAWAATAGSSDTSYHPHHHDRLALRNQEYSASAAAVSEQRSRDRYARSSGGR